MSRLVVAKQKAHSQSETGPKDILFYMAVSRRAVICDWVWRVAGGRPHRFPHNNFSSVYRIFTKFGHMISLWKGKTPIYFGVIMSPLL